MNPALVIILGAMVGYLLGAIPFALLIARTRGVDIRKVGSGNVGATNVFRCVGKSWGVLTFFCDALKGWLPAAGLPWLANQLGQTTPSWFGLLCGCAAIVGHTWPVYIGFKGGKGVATSAGVLLGVAPWAGLIGLLSWALLFAITRYVSVASIGAAAVVPVVGWIMYASNGLPVPVALTALGLLIIVRHRANIQRLLRGEENKASSKRKAST